MAERPLPGGWWWTSHGGGAPWWLRREKKEQEITIANKIEGFWQGSPNAKYSQ
jgi:hypothetical protein